MTFGDAINELRHAQHLTPDELSAGIGLNTGRWILNIEEGRVVPPPKIVIELAELLDGDVRELLRLAGDDAADAAAGATKDRYRRAYTRWDTAKIISKSC